VDEDMDAADKRPPWVEPIDKARAELLKQLLAQQSFDISSTVSPAGGGPGGWRRLQAVAQGLSLVGEYLRLEHRKALSHLGVQSQRVSILGLKQREDLSHCLLNSG
jgi:hypothetical protein